MTFRAYDPARDKEAAHRIWRESGWLGDGDDAAMDVVLEACRAAVAELNGEAECLVLTTGGGMCYLEQRIPFACVIGVTTSRIARKQGLASRLTARQIAADAVDGAQVAGLGMFEQGFYNQLGMGTGSYEMWASFDPARLRVAVRPRVAARIGADDWADVHACLLSRRRAHGLVDLGPAEIVRAEMMSTKGGFGLGYHDGPGGKLTHHIWCRAQGEHGPYSVRWMSYQTLAQFLELMALLKTLGDQVHLIRMREPPGIQLQDLIEQPLKQRHITEKSPYEAVTKALAYWQVRICDLAGCLSSTHLCGERVRFNLTLRDPIARFLDEDAPWHGIGGSYVVTLGPESSAAPGADPALPELDASVGAFTRLWLGVAQASALAATDDLRACPDLLAALDRVLCLPQPKVDWDF
ncbi:MAG: hypothetical protein JXA09_02265 [Anaerolineae bacterium]|nr:hypothetical protein [Anaerolineae bacterium]